MHPVYLGTCGWSYKDWAGNFYPAGLKPADYLAHYAERFDIVEVDSTFYGTPAVRTVEGWRDKTPDGFGFFLKVPQVITHEKLLKDSDRELAAFLRAACRAVAVRPHEVPRRVRRVAKGLSAGRVSAKLVVAGADGRA